MKKIYKLFAISAVSALAFISCTQEQVTDTPTIVNDEETGILVTINAGQPVSKTMMSGSTPYWCDGDAIGVSNGTSTNAKFDENSIDDGETALTATFSGKVGSEGTYYAYSPYTSNGVSSNGAKVDIPLTQRPTATSFDGSADVMVSKSFDVSTTSNTTIENLQFARLGAIVKVVLIDNSPSYDLSSQHPTTLSLTAEANLVGRVYIDMVNQELGDLYSGGSVTVTAQYTALTQFAINGSNAAYFVVYPQTLAGGTHLVLNAATESYNISKDIILPAGGIELKSGKVTTLNISIADSHISAATVYPNVEATNWDYSFTSNPWGSTSGNVDLTSGSTTINWNLSANYATYNSDVLALNTGTNKNEATISTNNVVTNVEKVVVRAKTNSGKAVTLEVKVGDESLGSETLSSVTSLTDYTFTNATPLSGKISIEFTDPTGGYQIKEIKINPKLPVTLSFASASLGYNTIDYNTCTGQTATASPNLSAITENISYALSGDAIGSVNASTGVVTLNGTIGSATITASFAGNELYAPAEASYTITVSSLSPGSEYNPYSSSDAYDAATTVAQSNVYVKGIVSAITTAWSSQHKNVTYTLSDDGLTSGKQFTVFRGAAASADVVAVGDAMIVKGSLIKYNNTTPEFEAGAVIQSSLRMPSFASGEENFVSSTSVTLSAADGATIYYTTDGTTPSSSSSAYSSAIDISSTTTIKAIAEKDGLSTGVASKTFTKVSGYAVTFGTPSNGSITVKHGDTTLSSGAIIAAGETINITVTPDSGYQLETLVYNDGTDHDIKTAKSFTMPSAAVSIVATFASTGGGGANSYTITFSNNASSATALSATTNATTVINASSTGYVTSKPFTVNDGNIYYGDTKTCIRLGKSGNSSSLTIALSASGQVKATSIVVNCNNTGGKNNSDAELNVNSIGAQTTTESADDYVFNFDSPTDISAITLTGTASIRIYSITVNY